jgi:ABC-type antimicrobial peptide transport system permease subunit
MDWAVGIGIGLIVGAATAFWCLFTLVAIRLALGRGTNPVVVASLIGALLTLPAFDLGGALASGAVLPRTFPPQTIIAYLYTLIIVVVLVNFLPARRLIVWAAGKMPEQ